MSKKTKRCKLIVDGVRCKLDATHRLYDETGKRVKGTAYCEEHARQYIAMHHRWSNLTWTMRPPDPQTSRIAELEARIAGLEAQLQSFRDFNAPLLKVAAEEEPGAWEHLQEAFDEQPE